MRNFALNSWIKSKAWILLVLAASGLSAADVAFEYPYAGGLMASGVMEFAEAERCFGLALDSAGSDAERGLALAQIAGAKINRGDLAGADGLLKKARIAALRSRDQMALVVYWTQASEFALRQGRFAEADAANRKAFAEATRSPIHDADARDRLYFQRAGILKARGQKAKALAFMEQSFMSWALAPGYLANTSRENLGRAVLVFLDLRRVNSAFFFATLYADRAAFVPPPGADPNLKAEWGTAQICLKFKKEKVARVFFKAAAEHWQTARGVEDEEVSRLQRLAGISSPEGRP